MVLGAKQKNNEFLDAIRQNEGITETHEEPLSNPVSNVVSPVSNQNQTNLPKVNQGP